MQQQAVMTMTDYSMCKVTEKKLTDYVLFLAWITSHHQQDIICYISINARLMNSPISTVPVGRWSNHTSPDDFDRRWNLELTTGFCQHSNVQWTHFQWNESQQCHLLHSGINLNCTASEVMILWRDRSEHTVIIISKHTFLFLLLKSTDWTLMHTGTQQHKTIE